MSAPRRDFWIGLALTAVLILAKFLLEHGAFGRQVEHMTMNLQQLRLASAFRQNARVAVVDISDVARQPRNPPDDLEPVTDRAALEELIRAVDAAAPVAIGVDVLLDPPAGGALTEGERHLLDTCLIVQKRVPIYVAIFDGILRGPDAWLGERRYGGLAAYALVPRPSEFQTTTSMARTIEIRVEQQVSRVSSLAQALAADVEARELEQSRLAATLADRFSWLVRRDRVVRPEGGHFEAEEFLIDYGVLDALERTTIRASRAIDIASAAAQLRGKVVLIGRGQIDRTTDIFNVPTRSEPVAGVYVHAAATQTLLSAPLFRLTTIGRFVADALAALIPLGIVLRVRTRQAAAGRSDPGHGLASALTIGMAVAVFIAGYLFVAWTRIMWTDCLMVSAALLLHGPLERLTRGRHA